MNKFGNIRASSEANDYLERIASTMASMFSIPKDEAVSRISRFWDGLSFLSDSEVVALLHEDPDYWAALIFHERRPLVPAKGTTMSLSSTRAFLRGHRRIAVTIAIAPVLAGAATLAPTAAHADSGYGYCLASGCNGLDPYYEDCQVNAITVSSETYTYSNGNRYEVDLRYSPDCEANWARVVSSTAVPFCVKDGSGYKQTYTSAAGLTSWTNMVDGSSSGDVAYLKLPSPTEILGQNVLYADDTPSSGELFTYPC